MSQGQTLPPQELSCRTIGNNDVSIVINLGGTVGMLVAGRCSDRYGSARIATIWFAGTAVGVYLLGIHMALPLTYTVVFLTGMFLFSAQAVIYATVAGRSTDANRATAVGWVSGIGRFGAVFGPWLGGRLVEREAEGWGFTAFAIAAVLATVFVALTGLRPPRGAVSAKRAEELSTAG